MSAALVNVAEAIGAVSEQWREQLRDEPVGAPRVAGEGELAAGVELIYEGFALHQGRPRTVVDDAPESIRLLVGDWCYAAGLRRVIATGGLAAIDELAQLIGDVSAATADGATDARLEARWTSALDALNLPSPTHKD